MKRIPISAAAHIAETYGYDQVIIIARKVGDDRRHLRDQSYGARSVGSART